MSRLADERAGGGGELRRFGAAARAARGRLIGRDPTGGRALTSGERAIAAQAFGDALDPVLVRIHRAKWWPFQPVNFVMAPDGDLWFHPKGGLWREDYSDAPLPLRALFVHELTHVWQHQKGLCLPLRRHPFCRYRYTLMPGRPLAHYGIEQQAMIVQHGWTQLARDEPLGDYASLLPATCPDSSAV